ncbi:PIG-L deacetylase family protein [Nonomuraea sp. SYSU D8015]|uniref:PIG-L deacetylase family protein n=1 Tax=Nonomuraea sp. SYSU D8015 TaxID=2593644 RepID=UPI0016604D0E|nr:PIG-L family deacetylase [Nonomuraea sp. SYSU D8015]
MSAPVLVVSAHLDDAVLSWGGTIAALTRRGTRVVVLTVFAGCAGDPLPPYAEQYHTWWRAALADPERCAAAGTAAGGMRLRREEDATACAALDAEPAHLDFAEALYRRGAGGRPRCAAGDDLFSPPGPDDLVLEKAVAAELRDWIDRLRPYEVHAPAAVGGHLDHVLTARACAAVLRASAGGPRARWYEDLPYALEPPEHVHAPAAVSPLTGGDWERKIEAAAAYRSQHPMLWDDDWPDVLLAHARAAGGGTPAERHWHTAPGPNGDH